MQTVVGGIYRVVLKLDNAEHLSSTWLVGAFASTFPDAQIQSLDSYNADLAVVNIRWTKLAGEVDEGDIVSGAVEGLTLPGGAVPKGTVQSVEQVGSFVPSLESQIPNTVKLFIAGGFLAVTWYFAQRIKKKHPPKKRKHGKS